MMALVVGLEMEAWVVVALLLVVQMVVRYLMAEQERLAPQEGLPAPVAGQQVLLHQGSEGHMYPVLLVSRVVWVAWGLSGVAADFGLGTFESPKLLLLTVVHFGNKQKRFRDLRMYRAVDECWVGR